MTNERWYTVTSGTYTEWDRGSYSIVEATEILKEAIADGEENAVIAVIDEGDEDEGICFCIEEITLEDAERVAKAEIREACVLLTMELNDDDSVIGGTDGYTVGEWFVDDTPEELETRTETEREMAESMIDAGDAPRYEVIDGAIVFSDYEVAYIDGVLYGVCRETSGGHIVVLDKNFHSAYASTTLSTDRYYVVEKGMMVDLGCVWGNDFEWADEM